MRALVVDDYRLARKYLREILMEGCGFAEVEEVEEAEDGEAALELLGGSYYDLVILDIDMPRRDGLSLLAEAAPARPRCPFIVLSGLSERDYAERALRLGAAAYLKKGCSPEAIAEAAMAAIRRRP
jgi:two-component system response regulator YesN